MTAKNIDLNLRISKKSQLNSRSTKRSRKLSTALSSTVSAPTWLKLMFHLQTFSSAVTTLLAISVFGVYGFNVCVQKKFDEQYRKLEDLRRSERQIIVAKEALDHNLISNIDRIPNKLIREKPEQSFFMAPAPLRPSLSENPKRVTKSKPFTPLGY